MNVTRLHNVQFKYVTNARARFKKSFFYFLEKTNKKDFCRHDRSIITVAPFIIML